jgi:NitT/TauT family transport system ATP-binding protein
VSISPFISLCGVNKSYQEGTSVFENFNLEINSGEFVSIFGPIGCGKTTLLELIAGIKDYSGIIHVGGDDPGKIETGFVFQSASASLFPWTNALGNVIFALQVNSRKNSWRQLGDWLRYEVMKSSDSSSNGLIVKAADSLVSVGLPEAIQTKFPYELSGGQQQLVTIARALAPDPKLLLLDEPFNSLDYHTRLATYDIIWQWWRGRDKTVILVSHTPEDVLALGTRMIVLSPDLPSTKVKDDRSILPEERSFNKIVRSPDFIEMRNDLLNITLEG